LARQAVRIIPLQRVLTRSAAGPRATEVPRPPAFALCGGDAAEASKDWGPGGKEMNLRPVLHLMAARLPNQRLRGAGPSLAPGM
jgi:hypothetical protein